MQTGSWTCIDGSRAVRDLTLRPATALSTTSKAPDRSRAEMAAELAPVEVARRLREEPGTILLLDVREPYERDLAAIEPSLHIPMRDVPARAAEIPRDRELVVYCHGGTRSAMVAAFLEAHGFRSVANLAGGIDAWSVTVDPAIPRYD